MAFPQNATVGQIREMVENPGVPFRPPAVAVLSIDSRDRVVIDPATGYRIDTTTPNEIYINRQQTLVQGFFTRLGLTELSMQWNVPNVIDNGPCKNNTLLLERSATAGTGVVTGTYKISINEGFYTPNELAAEITDNLNTASAFGSADWLCSYAERDLLNNCNVFTITCNPAGAAVYFRIRPENFASNDDLCNVMGFSYPPKVFGISITGSFSSMLYTPYFDIVSANITKKQNVRDNSTNAITGQNLLTRVYLVQSDVTTQRERTPIPGAADCNIIGTRPFTLYRQYSLPKQIYWDTKEFIGVIDLRLVDYKGRTLYSPPEQSFNPLTEFSFCGNAANYQLTIQVTET